MHQVSLSDAFARIDKEEPRADRQDEKWQVLWAKHGKLLIDRRDKEELRERLTLARDRLAKWGKLAEALKRSGVRLSVRQGMVRLSFHLYNGDSDVDHVLEVARGLQ